MKIKSILTTVAALVISTSVYATPQYSGSTTGSQSAFITERGNSASTANTSGYYLWNDIADASSWSLRWTGKNADTADYSGSTIAWFGDIEFWNSSLGTTTEVLFGGSDSSSVQLYSDGNADVIDWTARTNATGGYDGLDFTLTSNVELLSFSLGSELFGSLTVALNDTAGTRILIGGTGGTFYTPDVLVRNTSDGKVQNFEIALVPEPSVIALFGLGLVGLGFASRRRQQS
jgi:hypothetical protein